jgi:hypothetical protein
VSEHARHVVQQFWRSANRREWEPFAALLHPELLYLVPQTRECARGRANFVEVFRTWPGDWRADLTQLISEDNRAVSVVDFVVAGQTMTGISFFELSAGLVRQITDHWPEPYEPPERATPCLERY